jgi:hypothetical protein
MLQLLWKNWLKHEMKDFSEHHIEQLSKRPQFNEWAIDDLWKSFLKEDPSVTWSRVWYLMVLDSWLEKNNIS